MSRKIYYATVLFVDLDNSLIKSDYLLESFFKCFTQNIFTPFIGLYIYLKTGKVGLKKYLYENSHISVKNLPYNRQVLDVIYKWRKDNPDKKVFLISASYHLALEKISNHLGCFDGWYGTENTNLKSENKLKKIRELTHDKNFTYIGDSHADLVIWENALECILVNPSEGLLKNVKKINNSIEVISSQNQNIFSEIIKTLRVHQWIKNLLIFIPAILSLKPLSDMLPYLVCGFFSFSFIASAFYILNDLLDIENDRSHHSKRDRSFASGSLSIIHGLIIFILLLAAGIFISIKLPLAFQILLFVYALASFAYSKFLKKIPIMDIMTLSSLYLLRVVIGGALLDITISNWLLTFSVFFFLFLAALKRWIELKRLNAAALPGRGYSNLDTQFISNLSYFSGLISVLVICLYIDSQQALTLYNESKLLWLIPIILLYWILETLLKVNRNQVDDDPVKYALKSKTSYISFIGFIIILIFA